MVDGGTYLKFKLDEFNKEHDAYAKLNRYEGELKKRWKRDYSNREFVWRNVNSRDELMSYIAQYTGAVEREKKLKILSVDTYEIDLALYHVTYALQKVIHCYHMDSFDFKTLSISDIDEIFDQLYCGVGEMKDINMRRSMWD